MEERRIAVVDDDEAALEALTSLVRSLGYAAVGFASAADFLSAGETVAGLVADVRMEGTGGLDLHAALVRSGAAVPTVLVTAFPDDRTRRRALAAGVAGFLAKPVDAAALKRCLDGIPDAA